MLLKQLLSFTTITAMLWAQAVFLILLLLVGVITPETVVFGYFFETIIIGIVHVMKLFLVIKHGKKDKPDPNNFSGYGMILFFIFHYGMFVGIQLIFAFSFFEGSIEGIKNGFELFHNIGVVLESDGMLLMLGSLLITNLGYFYANFWVTFKYKDYAPSEIFFSPYVRIFIQQFVVIFSGFFIVFLHAGLVAAVLLLVFRLFLDLIITAIRKDSSFLQKLAVKLAKEGQDPKEVQEQLEKLSE